MLCRLEKEDLLHSFFSCSASAVAGLTILGWAQSLVPNMDQEQALRLDVGETVLNKEEELALTTILGTGLSYIWEARVKRKRVEQYEVRAEIEATVTLLRKSRNCMAGDIIANITQNN